MDGWMDDANYCIELYTMNCTKHLSYVEYITPYNDLYLIHESIATQYNTFIIIHFITHYTIECTITLLLLHYYYYYINPYSTLFSILHYTTLTIHSIVHHTLSPWILLPFTLYGIRYSIYIWYNTTQYSALCTVSHCTTSHSTHYTIQWHLSTCYTV